MINELYEQVIEFHGHSCPGLAMGFRMTLAAMEYLNIERPKDEELVAIVENDACGVDAVQFISGCTFGKGNLIFRDYGKMVYTFFDRKSGKAVRINRKAVPSQKIDYQSKDQKINAIINSLFPDLFEIEEADIQAPEYARLYETAVCENCRETATIQKMVEFENTMLCQPCYKKMTGGNNQN